LNADFSYTLYKTGSDYIVIATELADSVKKAASLDELTVVASFKGANLERMKSAHPFLDRESLVIVGDHVTLESGTGCVPTAPGHGVEDFQVCRNYPELPVVVPVDEKGRLTELAGPFAGQKTTEANKTILERLIADGNLLATEHIIHQYPHCWRCKTPILFRATEQWFCSVDGFKEQTLEAIKSVKWIPSWGEVRIENMVKDRSDWCISRQRKWGVPIPIFYCEDCKNPIINPTTIDRIANLFDKEGPARGISIPPRRY
jgi:isoleucyl-tRNA synthetase